jgi:hypothetical protein
MAAGLTRLLPHSENFAPFTAIAVFAGVTFASGRAALFVPLAALLLKDAILEVLYRQGLNTSWGFYPDMWVVYGTIALIALLGRLAQGTRSPLVIAGATLGGSCIFFLVTNFAYWASGQDYAYSFAGLIECYTLALPFFRNSLMGDVCYATVLFGAWALAEARFPVLRPAAVPVPA